MDIKPEDLIITTYHSPNDDSNWVCRKDRGISILHTPTMIEVKSHEKRTQRRNQAKAMCILKEAIEDLYTNKEELLDHIDALTREESDLLIRLQEIRNALEFAENIIVTGE